MAVRSSLVLPWNANPLSQDDIERITEYFDSHGLEQFFSEMLTAVGKARPECPYAFMVEHMQGNGYSLPSKENVLDAASPKMRSFVKEWQSELNSTKDSSSRPGPVNIFGKTPRSVPSRNVTTIFAGKHEGPLEQRGRGDADISPMLDASESYGSDSILSWDFDVFAHSDDVLMRYVFKILQDGWNFSSLPIKENDMKNYIATVYANYRPTNPYHNFKHAFSVMSAVGCLLREGGQQYVDTVQTLAVLVSGLTHDVGHPGTSNDYFVKSKHEIAVRYNDLAVLENMHAALTFEIMRMPNNDILGDFCADDFQKFRKTSISSILSTDMKVHFDLTAQLDAYLHQGVELNSSDVAQRSLYHNCLVHAGDLSNPVLPTELCKQWAYKVVHEFYLQAEREKKEGLPSSPFMEYHPDNTLEFARLQVGFCSFVVKPFWVVLTKFYQGEKTQQRLQQLDANIAYWTALKDEHDVADKDEEKVISRNEKSNDLSPHAL